MKKVSAWLSKICRFAMSRQDALRIMGVPNDAPRDQIQKRYRELTKKFHPDVNKAPDANQQMAQINAAYLVLKDPSKGDDPVLKDPSKGDDPVESDKSFLRDWVQKMRRGDPSKRDRYRKTYNQMLAQATPFLSSGRLVLTESPDPEEWAYSDFGSPYFVSCYFMITNTPYAVELQYQENQSDAKGKVNLRYRNIEWIAYKRPPGFDKDLIPLEDDPPADEILRSKNLSEIMEKLQP